MPNIQNRLCNPTPFPVRIKWHAGINIVVPPDGYKDLEVAQMDDFRDGKPGSEAVRELMDHAGVFLRDADRSYEVQALQAIRKSFAAKKVHYDGVVNNLRRRRASEGISENPEAFEEILGQMGMNKLRGELDALKKREKFLLDTLGDVEAETPVQEPFDPKKTLVFLDPPKVFPSEVALQMFLNDEGNEEVRQQYERWIKANATLEV